MALAKKVVISLGKTITNMESLRGLINTNGPRVITLTLVKELDQ